jgi:hypothetical protein
MSANEIDLLNQMSAENTNIGQAVQEKPPQIAASQMPELDQLGLDAFRVHMSENGYNTFLSIMHWAVMVQRMSNGETVEWSDETFAGMSAGFVGFGNPIQWEATYSSNIAIIVHSHYLNWHAEGAGFRRNNPLPHKLIREVAPLFANMNKGWQHAQAIRDLTNDPRSFKGV